MGSKRRYTHIVLLLIFYSGISSSGQFHVTTNASSGGNGTLSNPWQLQVALAQTSAVHPGDTINVHGGTYLNPTNGQDHVAWTSTISGTASAPIIVRAWPGDHPALDGANSQQNDILRIVGSNVWFIGLEIYSSSTNRFSPSGGSFPPSSEIDRGTCVGITQDQTIAGIKIINCIIHDGFVGYGNTSATSTSAELYGCLLYNNGWFASDRNHGHNIYIQNVAGNVRAQNSNVIWGAFENLVQAYGTQNTDDFSFDQNTVFAPEDGGFLVGGAQISNNLSMTGNYLYSGTTSSPLLNLGWVPYGAGLSNANITGNYIGWGELEFQSPVSGNISGNTIYYGALSGASAASFPNNSWSGSKPTGTKIAVIPNKYEAGRANIAVYNWDKKPAVAVDLSGIFNPGDNYTLIDAQNPSVVVASGTYAGPITIAMTGLLAVNPIGQGTRTHSAPEFGAFIATGGTGIVAVQKSPTLVTSAAGNITSTGAQLNGWVNPNGLSTAYHFEYGPTTSYGSSTSTANAGSGTSAVSVNGSVSGLSAGTTYHYRLVASNSAGPTNGNDLSFTTSSSTQTSAPTVTTSAPGGVTSTGAQLNGTVNPNGLSTAYHFEYGPTTSYGSSTSSANAGSGTSGVSVNATLSGLSAGTTYHCRLVASNNAGPTNGNDLSFTTSSSTQTSAPTVTTSAPGGVTSAGAQLNGLVNPNGLSTAYHFEYGPTTSYGSSTSTANAGSGTSGVIVNAALSGLSAGTTYHYRLVASNSAGPTNGNDLSFTTSSSTQTSAPTVTTSAPGSVTSAGAQLNGLVNPNGLSTAYHFEYGPTTSYGSSTSSANAGSGTSGVSVNATLSGLSAGTTYHCRLVASNSAGPTNGNDLSFTTSSSTQTSAPTVSTSAPSNVTSTGAQLNGSVNPNGLSTAYHFEYGPTTSYGSSTSSANAGSGTSTVSVNATLSGLSAGTTYHYRLVASNSAGPTNGSDRSFTGGTPPPPPTPPTVSAAHADSITSAGARISGSVTPNGSSTVFHVEYGVAASYGSSTQSADAGSGTSPVHVSVVLSGLTPETLYHFRLVASNSDGTTNGNDSTFSTAGASRRNPGTYPADLPQNYPNPFNPATQIDYVLYVSDVVTLKIFNMLGVEVVTLVSGFQVTGKHSVMWDAKGCTSGMYFCVLKTGGVVSTRRMILIR